MDELKNADCPNGTLKIIAWGTDSWNVLLFQRLIAERGNLFSEDGYYFFLIDQLVAKIGDDFVFRIKVVASRSDDSVQLRNLVAKNGDVFVIPPSSPSSCSCSSVSASFFCAYSSRSARKRRMLVSFGLSFIACRQTATDSRMRPICLRKLALIKCNWSSFGLCDL